MKKILLFLSCVMSPILVNAQMEIDGLFYYLSDDGATVSENGESYSGDIFIPDSVFYEGEAYPVTAIGANCFYGCQLTSVEIPNTVKRLEDGCFMESTIENVTIPTSVEYIGSNCFSDSKIRSIEVPSSVTYLGRSCFSNCVLLEDARLFNSGAIDDCFRNCSVLKYVEITDSITSLGSFCFANCWNLESVLIPNSITSLGDYTFSGCSSLSWVELPETIDSIGENCFYGCRSLDKLVLPASLASVGDFAFYSCNFLQSVTFLSATPPSLGDGVFDDVDIAYVKVCVPDDALDAYKAIPAWNELGVTSISNSAPLLSADATDASLPLTDLFGREVTNLRSGKIYIRNGKKQMFK